MKPILAELEPPFYRHETSRSGPVDVSCYPPEKSFRRRPVTLRRAGISRFRSPEIDAAAQKHDELRQRLVAAVRAVCPPWLLDRQDDLVQTAMMAVLRQQSKLDSEREFPASYLRLAAYTAMVDEIRRLRSRKEVPLEVQEAPAELATHHEDPERLTLSNEISSTVRECLKRLAPSRRVAVTLHLLSYNVPQIAQRLDWKVKQAENLVYRGLVNLRQCLEAKGITP